MRIRSNSLATTALTTAIAAVTSLVAPLSAWAAPTVPAALPGAPTSGGGITNPAIGKLGDSPAAAQSGAIFGEYFITIWTAIIGIGAFIVIIYFLWGALDMIYAGGDSSKMQKAQNKITQSMIGLVVLVGSFVIIGWLSLIFFGTSFDILNPILP